MSEHAFHISQLIQKKLRGVLTASEEAELDLWLAASPYHREVYAQLNDEELVKDELKMFEQYDAEGVKKKIYEQMERLERERAGQGRIGRVRMGRVRWAMAAAAAIVFLVFSLLFLVNRDKVSDTPVAVTPQVQDVAAPTETRAVITLADGRKVALDSLASISEGGAIVSKGAEGEVSYKLQVAGYKGDEVVYNTLYNPRGSKVVSLTLSDGTRVWLNAESSLRYPVAFPETSSGQVAGSERQVEITGEAYFEVSKGNKRFIVEANGVRTEVLGTHFNVHAYEDEGSINVTLLEGSVRVGHQSERVQLVPGSQAKVLRRAQDDKQRGSISVIKNVDTEMVMAWKNGFFSFHEADLPTVMRALARWYDVEVRYEGRVPKRSFEGSIDRNLSLARVLAILERMNVKFRIEEGKRIVILP